MKWMIVMLCGAGVAMASDYPGSEYPRPEYPNVDAAVAECDAHVAALRAGFANTPGTPDDEGWIKARLAHLVAVDQYVRFFLLQQPQARAFSPDETTAFKREIGSRMSAVDTASTAEIKQLLARHGWFGISRFGAEADNDAWLLVQHADHDPAFQREVVAMLEPLVARHETTASHFAYLADRVAMSHGDPGKRTLQRYGTQGQCTGPGTWAPFPVEDPDKLDERRHSVGLEPMGEYQKMFKDICH